MGQSGSRNGQFGYSDNQTVAERANAFFRELFPRDTAKRVSAATGVPVATVNKWLVRSSAPSAGALVACWVAFGPAFLSAVSPGLGWVEVAAGVVRRQALHKAVGASDAELERAMDALRGQS